MLLPGQNSRTPAFINTVLTLFVHENVQTYFIIYLRRNKMHCAKYVL